MPRTPDTSPQTVRVFQALLSEPTEWRHGYALSKETALASGTLYPILIRLAERGLLDTRWEPPSRPGRPPRHAYRLTADGATYARSRLADQATTRPTGQSAQRPSLAMGAA